MTFMSVLWAVLGTLGPALPVLVVLFDAFHHHEDHDKGEPL